MELYGLDMFKITLVALEWGTIPSGITPVMLSFLLSPPLISSGTVHMTVACFFKSSHRDVLNSIDDDPMGTCSLLPGSW